MLSETVNISIYTKYILNAWLTSMSAAGVSVAAADIHAYLLAQTHRKQIHSGE